MKRTIFSVFGLSLVLGVFVFALWPLSPVAPATTPVASIADGQETFARRLELGLLYERSGLLDKAQSAYEEAATSEQGEIVAAAHAGLDRVLFRQQNPWLGMQTNVRAFLQWMGENLLRLIIAGAAVWLIWMVIARLPRRPGYLLLPFEDFTEDHLGRGLHALVNLALQEAKHTHLRAQCDLLSSLENLEVPLFGMLSEEQDVLGGALSALDSFSVGGIDLPLGKMFLTVRRWVSVHERVVTGSLHQHGDTLRLGVEIREASTQKVVQAWELSAVAGERPAEQVVALAQELAFRILFTLCPRLEARTWHSLQLFTAGLRESQQYGVEAISRTVLRKAADLLSQALMIDPGYISAHYLLGTIYSNLGCYKEARDAFREVIERGDRLVVEATYNLGLAFYHEFRDWANDKAVAQFTRVQEALAAEKRDTRQKLLLALAHCGLASAYAQRVTHTPRPGAGEDADSPLTVVEHYCHAALALAGEREEVQAAAHNALGVAYLRAGQQEKAETELKAAIEAHPRYLVAYVNLAKVYADTQPDEAIQWLERAIRWHPDYEYAHYWLGRIYEQQGQSEAAKKAYAQALETPDARNRLGEILAAEGEYERALAEFHKAVTLDRGHARAWRNLAWWTVEAGTRDEDALREATGWARRALDLDSSTRYEWLSHDALGWVLLHRGLWQEAQQELLRSVEGEQEHIQNRYHLAYLYRQRGETDQAKETLAAALQLKEHGYWREKAVVLMKELSQRVKGSDR